MTGREDSDLAAATAYAVEHGQRIPCHLDPSWTLDPAGRSDRALAVHDAHMNHLARQCLTNCPVLLECAAWAITQDELVGVVAGRVHAVEPRCGTYAGWQHHARQKKRACPACLAAKADYCRAQRAAS